MTRRLIWLAAAALMVVIGHALDGYAYREWVWSAPADRDWGRLLRVLGFAPTWGVVALGFWLEGRGRSSRDRPDPAVVTAQALVFAVVLGGIASEAAKLLIRRERPADAGGLYQFRAFDVDPFSTSRLGLPSGHTTVAFAGAGALAARYPRAAPLLFAVAAGCGLTRVFAQAHFLSDVVVGALGGGTIGRLVARRVAAAADEKRQ